MAFRACEICKKPLNPERAEGLPMTRLCIEHAHEIEKLGGEFKTYINEELTSKQGSLKKNYGGVTLYRRRNQEAMLKLREAYEARG